MSNRKNFRKRAAADSDEEDGGATSAVVQKAKAPSAGPLVASTSKPKKREDAFYESARTVVPSIGKDNGATAPIVDEEADPSRPPGPGAEKAGAAGKLYTGAANYQKYVEKREVMDRKASSIGPIKAPSNVRLTCRFDYQPDLCKDYKETGYCGFGDACKFMHDRGDYKAGWELDRDWKAEQEKKRLNAALAEMEGGDGAGADEEVDDGLPFACSICRGPFNTPVETKCGHYFCEGCALSQYSKSRRCFICNEQTFGIFNTAVKLEAKIKRLKGKADGAGGGDGAGDGGGGDDGDGDDEDLSKYSGGDGSFKADIGWQIPGNTFQKGKDVLGWGT